MPETAGSTGCVRGICVPSACRLLPGRLAVIPVKEEQGEGAHHEEEEDPHTEASVVFDGLVGRSTDVSYTGLGLKTLFFPVLSLSRWPN